MTSPVPTIPTPRDYLDAAVAYFAAMGYRNAEQVDAAAEDMVKRPAIRAAVDSAFAAGWRARVPEGAEESVQLGAAHDECEHWGMFSDESGQLRWLADHPGWQPLRRRVVTLTTEWPQHRKDEG